MRKTLFVATCLVFLTISSISFQSVLSQKQKSDEEKESSKNVDVSETPATDDSETDDPYTPKWLRNDMRVSDVVAYVDVKEVKYCDRSDTDTDCENNQGGGYCAYALTAEVKEIFKGKIETKPFVFHATADAGYPQKYFLGKQIVFLLDYEEDKNKERNLGTLENSRRSIEHNVLEKMRNILDPKAPINENDEREPYAIKYIKTNFEEADAVVYADVVSFKSDAEGFGSEAAILKAKIKEVFKGKQRSGQTFEYKDDLLYRPMRQEDLGEQVIYLKKEEENGKTVFRKIEYTEGWIQHDILEKLRKIAKEKSNGEN
jgi:hypothetical protein